MWGEPTVYSRTNLHSIEPGKLPPVNYDSHIINSHSLTHAEAQSHVVKNGKTIDQYFEGTYFYGESLVIRLQGNSYKPVSNIERVLKGKSVPPKILITTEFYPTLSNMSHDPNYVLTLSQEAADYLVSIDRFNLYGTSWKSSDFNPGSSERPIHKTLFQKAVILECLNLRSVPEGSYLIVAYPLLIDGASESPLSPILFSEHELFF